MFSLKRFMAGMALIFGGVMILPTPGPPLLVIVALAGIIAGGILIGES